MTQENLLINQKCQPWNENTPVIEGVEAEELLKQLNENWSINEQGGLQREWDFEDFNESINFVNKVAAVADSECHHPDIFISWGTCMIEIYTYATDALSKNDFILAAKIDQIK
jgi:4a-hydroxytetrahydrobiopterin dehydratase